MTEKLAEKTYRKMHYILHHEDRHGYCISIINSIGIMIDVLYFKNLETAQEWFDGVGSKDE
jgi:hypothetical protein